MATEVLCPICGATYNLADDQVGKKVRCRKCEHAFVAGDPPPRRGRGRDDEDDDRDAIQDRDRRRPARADRRARDEDDEDRPRRKTPPRDEQAKPRSRDGGGIPVLPLVLAGVGILVGLLLLVGGIVFWTMSSDDAGGNPPGPGPVANPALPGLPNFPNAPNGPPIAPPPGFPPVSPAIQNHEEALAALKATEPFRRRDGAAWLAGAPPAEDQKAKVAGALEAALTDTDGAVRTAAAGALGTWGGPASVPGLIKLAEAKDGQATERAIESLGKLKDPRAAAALAALLKDFFQRSRAANALQAIGRPAEKDVARYAFDADGGAAAEAQRLLKSFGSSPEIVLDQAVEELKSTDDARRRAAADWLAKAPPVAARRAEVARALEPMLRQSDGQTRNAALAAVKVWGTEVDAEAVAALLPDFFARNAARDALRALGPVAAPAVAGCLFHKDQGTRDAAAELLRGYGTKDDVVLTRAVDELKGTDRERRKFAADYLAKMVAVPAKREEVATALVPLLEDSDNDTRSAAFKAARVWGTKDCAPGLVRQLADDQLGSKDLRHLAMDALAEIKDERGVWPVVLRMTNFFDKDKAAQTLRAMGPVVATAAAKQVGHVDPATRKVAWDLLRDTASPKDVDLAALKAAAGKEPIPAVKVSATAALKFIQSRTGAGS